VTIVDSLFCQTTNSAPLSNWPNSSAARDEEHMLGHGFYNKHSHEQGKANRCGSVKTETPKDQAEEAAADNKKK
jgi:hypothetical protein